MDLDSKPLGEKYMSLVTAFRKTAVGSAILAISFLAANEAEPQSMIFADGFELGSSAGWELSDEEILRALIDMPAPGSPEVSRVLEVLAGRVLLATDEVLSTFELSPTAIAGQYGAAYHLSIPLEPGSYTVEIVGAAVEDA